MCYGQVYLSVRLDKDAFFRMRGKINPAVLKFSAVVISYSNILLMLRFVRITSGQDSGFDENLKAVADTQGQLPVPDEFL